MSATSQERLWNGMPREGLERLFYCPYLELTMTKRSCISRQVYYPLFYGRTYESCRACDLGQVHLEEARALRAFSSEDRLQS